MKNRLLSGILAILMLAGCAAAMMVSSVASDNVVITIDPGHGGNDPGNVASKAFGGDNESAHVYDISMYVKERLGQYGGVTVYLTRGDLAESEDCPSLESRPNYAKEMESDCFVSIHTNSFSGTGRAYGAEIWVPDAITSYNNQIAIDSQAASSMVISEMHEQTGVRVRSSSKTSKSKTAMYSTGEYADGLAVIRQGRKNNIPVVMLIETCFASDKEDYNSFLSTAEKRRDMGYAIADGLAKYYNLTYIGELTATYGSKLSSIPLPTNWAWVNPNDTVGNVGVNTATAIYMESDTQSRRVELTVTVTKADPTFPVPTNITVQYKSKLSDNPLPDGWSWADGDAIVSSLGQQIFTAIYTPEDSSNYNTASANITVISECNVHIFTDECDTECECGYTRTPPHLYDNDCDAICNLCSFERTPMEHVYSSACDAICNSCNLERTPEDHVYDHGCDKDCNVCGEERETNHAYTNSCDVDCNNCSAEREITHTYSYACDAYCDVCGFVRTPGDHAYSNSCDSYCDLCSFKRTPEAHKYTSSCDTTCDVCNSEREIAHTYDNGCDAFCNVCEERRDVAHAYDNACDSDCSSCGEVRGVAHSYANETDADCDVCGAVRSIDTATAEEKSGCGSQLTSVFAIVASISVAFAVTKKRK